MTTLQGTGTNSGILVEVADMALTPEVRVRTWASATAEEPTDVRFSAEAARTLAANLLQAAQQVDGRQVSFFWHLDTCTPEAQAEGHCPCSGKYWE